MDKQEVLGLVDHIMHMYASSYRSEARKIVEEKFSTANSESKPCSNCGKRDGVVLLCKVCEDIALHGIQ